MACWLILQHPGPSKRQSLPPQVRIQMILGGIAFTRLSLALEYEGRGTGTCSVIEERRGGKCLYAPKASFVVCHYMDEM